MPNIKNYLDYREYLYDCYRERKSDNPSFSYQVIANKAGFKSKSFFPHVVDGKKNLSDDSIIAIARAFRLSEDDRAYFEVLVAFNQARSHAKKQYFFSKLMELSNDVNAKLIGRDNYAFYSQWYHNTIRELVPMIDFKEDFALLGRHVKPSISARQARQSVRLLEKLGLLKKENGRYWQVEKDITTGDQVQSLAVENFHLQNLNLAGESIDNCPAQERDLSCLIAGLSQEDYEKIREEVKLFRKKLVGMINGSSHKPERVYHIAMQLFPTSELFKRSHDDET